MDIKGYRELSQEEIDLVNEIKAKAIEVGQLVDKLRVTKATPAKEEPTICDQRWVSIGNTDLQTGFMALVRSVTKPTTF